MLDISDAKLRRFYESQKGSRKKVLFEHTRRSNKMHGFTENYVKLYAVYDSTLINRVTEVVVGEYDEEQMAMKAIF